MNLNLLSYAIYVIITLVIIYFLGRYFYRNGGIYIKFIFGGNIQAANSANNLLLLLYYLLNMGYATAQLYNWTKITHLDVMLNELISKIAFILILLALIHYINLFALYIISKRVNHKNQFFTS